VEQLVGKLMLDGQLDLIFNLLFAEPKKSGVAAATGGLNLNLVCN